MLLYVLIGLALLIALVLIAASTKPNTVHYERSASINASPEKILPHITDFRRWAAWSPWDKKDPAMKRDFGGAASGVGATYGWNGNNKVGEGKMTITEAGGAGVRYDMRFIKPWKAECVGRFVFEPKGNATHVRWTMDGPQIFMGKVFSLFFDMDKAIGKDFEAGLAGLKAEAEK